MAEIGKSTFQNVLRCYICLLFFFEGIVCSAVLLSVSYMKWRHCTVYWTHWLNLTKYHFAWLSKTVLSSFKLPTCFVSLDGILTNVSPPRCRTAGHGWVWPFGTSKASLSSEPFVKISPGNVCHEANSRARVQKEPLYTPTQRKKKKKKKAQGRAQSCESARSGFI